MIMSLDVDAIMLVYESPRNALESIRRTKAKNKSISLEIVAVNITSAAAPLRGRTQRRPRRRTIASLTALSSRRCSSEEWSNMLPLYQSVRFAIFGVFLLPTCSSTSVSSLLKERERREEEFSESNHVVV